MRLAKILLSAPALLAATLTTPTDDMRSLQTASENAASVVNQSLNSTSGMNTSSTIQTLIYQIGASTTNLNDTNATVAAVPWSTNTSADTPGKYDTPYLAYLDSVNDFADAITRRGKVFHDEQNAPVYRALQGLAAAVHGYGLYLRDRSMISRRATISTITAGSYVIQAQSVWANNRNFPGRKARRVRRSGSWLEQEEANDG